MFSRVSSRCTGVGASFRRAFATEVAPVKSEQQPPLTQSISESSKKASRPHISTAIILNRAPILTRTPSPFEKAYYSYSARIRRSLHNPFPYEFYFKQGTLLETRFTMEERKRERLAFGPEFLEKESVSEDKRQADIAAVDQLIQQEEESEILMPRVHQTDLKEDHTSLDRKGQRNLYLLLHTVENGENVWRFPQGEVEKGQLLHQAAQNDLFAECGDKMDVWIVGRAPVGVYKPEPLEPSNAESTSTDRVVFFFKAHIMAGQVAPEGKNIQGFAWLTKEEIKPRVGKHYWDSIGDILSDF